MSPIRKCAVVSSFLATVLCGVVVAVAQSDDEPVESSEAVGKPDEKADGTELQKVLKILSQQVNQLSGEVAQVRKDVGRKERTRSEREGLLTDRLNAARHENDKLRMRIEALESGIEDLKAQRSGVGKEGQPADWMVSPLSKRLVPPSWGAFEFNGQTYFIVPAGSTSIANSNSGSAELYKSSRDLPPELRGKLIFAPGPPATTEKSEKDEESPRPVPGP